MWTILVKLLTQQELESKLIMIILKIQAHINTHY